MIPAEPALRISKLRDLDLREPSAPGRPSFLSAASGLVHSGGELYVLADDELHLGCFPAAQADPGELLRLFDGELPLEARERKRRKPDLEILLRLPPLAGCPHGALLALGSGSRPSRRRGALLALDAEGRAGGAAAVLDCAPLYERLQQEFDDLNLEGAWLEREGFFLLQRGNRGGSRNAMIEFDSAAILNTLMADHVLPDIAPRQLREIHLGDIDGVPLGFTDACGLRDGVWMFSAAAEDTQNAYADGGVTGSAIGIATADGTVAWQQRIEPVCKIEGIDLDERGRILCVTDADDAAAPARLLRVDEMLLVEFTGDRAAAGCRPR